MAWLAESNFLIALGVCAAAALSTVLGSLFVLFSKEPSPRLLAFGLAFAGGAMVYVSLVEIFWKADQGFAQLLQSGHFALELGFGRALVLLFEFTGLESDCAPVGIGHDGRPMAFLNGCYDTCFDPDFRKTPHDPIIFQP